MSIVVMRKPTLQEDEGRHQYIRTFDTDEEAREWVAQQVGEYFGPTDYYLARDL